MNKFNRFEDALFAVNILYIKPIPKDWKPLKTGRLFLN